MAGAPMGEWEPGWNSTWALRNDNWTLMGFDEASELEKESEKEKEGKKRQFWEWYNGKYTGTRSLG